MPRRFATTVLRKERKYTETGRGDTRIRSENKYSEGSKRDAWIPWEWKVVSVAKETSTPRNISDPDVHTGCLIQSWGKTKSTFMEGSHLFKNSNFSFKIKDPLSISWNKSQRRFVLRCPYYFDVETLLHKIQPTDNYDPTLKPKTNLFLRLPGITILNKKGILFLFLPAQQWAGIFHVFHININNGLTLYFSKKASLEQIIIPKGKLLGYLCAIAQLQE